VIITLIVDLDRPQGGLIKVGQSALTDVQRTMLPSVDPVPKTSTEE
jgi:hypothetical protein